MAKDKKDDDKKRDAPELGSSKRAAKSNEAMIREIKADLPRPNSTGVGVKGARALVYTSQQYAARNQLAANLAQNRQLLKILSSVNIQPVSAMSVSKS